MILEVSDYRLQLPNERVLSDLHDCVHQKDHSNRDAGKEDAYDLARLHALAAEGLIEYCYEGAVEGVEPIDLLARVFADEHEPYTYRCCVVAEEGGIVVGKLHSYAWDEGASLMPPDPYIINERAEIVDALAPPTPYSWHIEAMATLPDYQGRGLGSQFLELAKTQAKRNRFDCVSLHVFEQNTKAVKLYHRFGFHVTQRVPIPRELQKVVYRSGDNLLMICSI